MKCVLCIYWLVKAVILCALHHAGYLFVLRMLYSLCTVLNVACAFFFLSAGIERKSKSLTEFKSMDKQYYSRSHVSQQTESYQRGKCCVFFFA